MELAVEACPGLSSVVECDIAGVLERAGCRDTRQRTVHRAARERGAHDVVLLRGEEQRQRRRPVAEVCTGDLSGLDRAPEQ